ncbi:WD40/YVTN repeat-like-containing domain,WD40-repeat-containing domain [Cinara cedri]|uniref:WD40/YVTN repeat-like-containing domain,WD40-repeat-containing domain n=1 Tax=Cinara cedri TaxID=506608 RepID=A0A5E4NFA9_9HEMI|nr:WD40/YVTN repeat-like-containing domain,WD40-repeat-containing domain [Cinara cedri]
MKADVSSGVRSLEPQYYFGLTVGSGNNCFFLNDEKIVYRAAGVIVVHDLLNHSQQYVYLTDSQKTITTMDLNHGKNFVAVAESGKRPTASVYDLVKSKRIRHLTLPYVTEATGFVMIKFSHDDVYLAALTNKPDFVMYYYEWRKSKIVSHLRVVHLPNSVAIVNDMVLNPGNNKLCCFVGKGLFRSMIMGEVVWKQYGFYKANKYNFTSACWLNDERLIAGTSEGQLFLFSKAELKAIYNVETLLKFDPRLTIDNPYNVRPPSNKRNMEIRCCTPVDGGLLMVVGKDQVYYYEVSVKNDPPYKKHALLERHTVYELPKNKHLEQIVGNDGKLRVINTLCVSPSGEMLMCITQRSLFYWASIGIENIDKTVELKLHGDDLHHGEVAGLSLSCWWPVFMTCGRLDRTVKLWNYVKRTLLFTERYDEDVLNVSLHPTGQCALLAFTSKVEFCMVHADQLETRRHFNVTDCSLIQFSRSGQMFALVDGLNVDIYSSITFEKLHRISKHEKKVSCQEEGRGLWFASIPQQ